MQLVERDKLDADTKNRCGNRVTPLWQRCHNSRGFPQQLRHPTAIDRVNEGRAILRHLVLRTCALGVGADLLLGLPLCHRPHWWDRYAASPIQGSAASLWTPP